MEEETKEAKGTKETEEKGDGGMEEGTKETGGMEDGHRKMEKRRNGRMEDAGMEEIGVLISDEFYGCL